MKNNGPVTGHEVRLQPGQQLVTSTDTKGRITQVNQAFCDVAGYTEAELIGNAHNVVRHPEMPPAAFKLMWNTLKSGRPWMGLVKNRCKNGDHYWVDAYVTPLLERGQIIGYESVRVAPERDQIARAEAAYAALNAGRPSIPAWHRLKPDARFVVPTLVAALPAALGSAFTGSYWPSLVAAVLAGAWTLREGLNPMQQRIATAALDVIDDPLATYLYTGRSDLSGRTAMALLAQQARLRTALGCIQTSSALVTDASHEAQQRVDEMHQMMTRQCEDTTQVSVATHEMTATNAEILKSIQVCVDKIDAAHGQVNAGQQLVQTSLNGMASLESAVDHGMEQAQELKAASAQIQDVVNMIRDIAEKTNLLSLNAAIEAARAGDAGRGFAVVANEVRDLSHRTQDSTRTINDLVDTLQRSINTVVDAMAQGHTQTQAVRTQSVEVQEAFGEITEAMGELSNLSIQIASASEEHGMVTQEIDQNVTNINQGLDQGQGLVDQTLGQCAALTDQASSQLALVERFR